MAWLHFVVWGPVYMGIGLALAWWGIRGRKNGLPGGRLSVVTFATGLLLLIVGIGLRLISGPFSLRLDIPTEFWEWYRDYRFIVPLLLGILAMSVLALPVRARTGRGTANLAPRTPLSFTNKWWLITPGLVLSLIVTLTIAAGMASEPDARTGRYTMYFVDTGGGRSMGTGIYGWFSSLPSLILLGIMMVVAAIALFLIARPALNDDQEQDAHTRIIRTSNVLMVGTGALLWHLGLIFGSLAATASLRGNFSTSQGNVRSWTTFAALEPTLNIASIVAPALGFALWGAVTLSAIPSRRRALVAGRP
ncbi:hypothetical protein DDA93_00295 [Arthrobacter sp. Bz4]|nr:hypothetical protein DDA93_00295 [Arthrobacter sp. Bz4]